MELTTTNLVFILAGILALSIAVLIFIYFSGGTSIVLSLLLGAA